MSGWQLLTTNLLTIVSLILLLMSTKKNDAEQSSFARIKNNEVKQETYQGVTENSSLADTTSFTSNKSISNYSLDVNKNIEKQQSAVTGSGKSLAVAKQTVAIENVTDLFEFVKQNDKKFPFNSHNAGCGNKNLLFGRWVLSP